MWKSSPKGRQSQSWSVALPRDPVARPFQITGPRQLWIVRQIESPNSSQHGSVSECRLGLIEDPETESHDAADASHAADLAGLAVAVAADQSSGDLAVASVVRLKPGVFSDDYYRSWRDTFDQGACSQAGGVAGSAETTIAGHPSFIGHCTGGVLTYHTYLPSGDVMTVHEAAERYREEGVPLAVIAGKDRTP